MEFKPPPKKKNFFALCNEEDDVIMEVMKQKKQNKGNVEVNIRKKEQEDMKQQPKDKNQAALDRLKAFGAQKDEDVIDINEEAIFKFAVEISNANDKVGQNFQFTPIQKDKKTSFEAPSRIMEPAKQGNSGLEMQKAQSELPAPKLGSKMNDTPAKRSPELKKSPDPEPPAKSKVEEEKEKNQKDPNVGKDQGISPKNTAKPTNSTFITKKTTETPKARGGGLLFGKNKNKDKPASTSAKPSSTPAEAAKGRGTKPIMMKNKPLQLKQGGLKGKNLNMGIDSEDENDYPFDDGIKCTIF